jgi:hypothetical protein
LLASRYKSMPCSSVPLYLTALPINHVSSIGRIGEAACWIACQSVIARVPGKDSSTVPPPGFTVQDCVFHSMGILSYNRERDNCLDQPFFLRVRLIPHNSTTVCFLHLAFLSC